jgi:peptidoglycan hydrolase-like protein with peptidoglycan-binding domain
VPRTPIAAAATLRGDPKGGSHRATFLSTIETDKNKRAGKTPTNNGCAKEREVNKIKFAAILAITTISTISITVSGPAFADDLTKIIQQDLVALGYEPGNTDGEATTQTIVAISKFQAENNLEVTGEATPQLAGVIKAKLNSANRPAAQASAPAVAAPAEDPAALQAAQQACIQEKMAQAQAANKKKRGLGSLMRAVGRTAGRFGGDAGQDLAQATSAVYDVNATAADLESAAEDLGLTTDDLEACRNPPR